MLTFGSNLSHPNWVIPPDECIWLNPFLGDVLLLCLHCSLSRNERHGWYLPVSSTVHFHWQWPTNKLCEWSREKEREQRGRETVCVCAHFPSVARRRFGTQSSTWRGFTHAHFSAHAALRTVWKSDKEDFALANTESQIAHLQANAF